MKQFDYNDYVQNLPDCFAKATDSNNYKLLEIARLSIGSLFEDIESVLNSLDIEQATGKTLDLYGEMLNQPRGYATDAQYKLMIKAKIMRNLSTGDYKSVINAICMTFNCDPSEILIAEKENSRALEIALLPLSVINEAGLTAQQTVKLIERLLPVGVKVESYLFEGTFELATSEEDMKVDGATKGLTDTYENMKNPDAIGGYLGITMGEYSENELPI